jgi:hypothetical protein
LLLRCDVVAGDIALAGRGDVDADPDFLEVLADKGLVLFHGHSSLLSMNRGIKWES